MAEVNVLICGDEGTGKSSLITALVKNTFVNSKIQHVLPKLTLPATLGTRKKVTTTIVDTSALPQNREQLNKDIRHCNVVLLVYSDNYSYERVGLFWLPHFRSLGVSVPVVLCANKSDLSSRSGMSQMVEDEMLPLLTEFKEIDSCIRTSAKELSNINEAFYLCQKAVIYPIALLYDSKESQLKPAAVKALQRMFYLSDKDQDSFLSDKEMAAFSHKCFSSELDERQLSNLKREIQQIFPEGVTEQGITINGFVALNKAYAEQGRHETIWIMLRTFHYADNLNLEEAFVHPKFDVPLSASAELSPAGYQFLLDLFLLYDKDNDGGLNENELDSLFAPTPGLPDSWVDSSFPSSTVVNDSGHVTLQGWLAQWSMTTFTDPKTTLEYLAYLGYEPSSSKENITAALKVTKSRNRQALQEKLDRSVASAYLVGAPGSGKSALLDAFISRRFNPTYHPTIKPRMAVNSVELPGGKQCYLIMEELGEREPAILENKTKLGSCDLLIFAYDSSDPDSFAHIPAMLEKYPHVLTVPVLFVALKADSDKANQRAEKQPDEYTAKLGLHKPLHVSVTWHSVAELFVRVAEAALKPATTWVGSEEELPDRTNLYIAAGAGISAAAAFIGVYRQLR